MSSGEVPIEARKRNQAAPHSRDFQLSMFRVSMGKDIDAKSAATNLRKNNCAKAEVMRLVKKGRKVVKQCSSCASYGLTNRNGESMVRPLTNRSDPILSEHQEYARFRRTANARNSKSIS